MKRIILIGLLCFWFIPSFSQGKVEIVADSQLYEVVKIRYERKKTADAKRPAVKKNTKQKEEIRRETMKTTPSCKEQTRREKRRQLQSAKKRICM